MIVLIVDILLNNLHQLTFISHREPEAKATTKKRIKRII